MPAIMTQKERVMGMIAFPEANKVIAVSDLGILVVSELTSGDEL
jgi:hypothetical protein